MPCVPLIDVAPRHALAAALTSAPWAASTRRATIASFICMRPGRGGARSQLAQLPRPSEQTLACHGRPATHVHARAGQCRSPHAARSIKQATMLPEAGRAGRFTLAWGPTSSCTAALCGPPSLAAGLGRECARGSPVKMDGERIKRICVMWQFHLPHRPGWQPGTCPALAAL